jgi:hypothetical protein
MEAPTLFYAGAMCIRLRPVSKIRVKTGHFVFLSE